jgi:hypothetical protein
MRFIDQRSFLLLGVLLLGCGPKFDPPDQLSTLRILGVQKDLPYAQPGQTVNLQMLWEDASPNAGRPIQLTWSGPCIDPDGDLYYGCFTPDHLPSLLGGLTHEPTTSFVMPESYAPSPGAKSTPVIRTATTENNAPYGIVFIFFAACAGNLVPITTTDQTALPFACQDTAGNALGSDDFVAGYTSIYSFNTFTNNNPVISGFEFNGQTLPNTSYCGPPLPNVDPTSQPSDCVPLAESPAPDPDSIDCSATPPDPRCIPTCANDGESPCPAYPIQPTLIEALNQDQDDVSVMQLGHPVGEQMWIDYYTDGGGFKSPVRLLNDATSGWNPDYGTDFYAPKEAKISRVWALVHDNRGGVAWAGITLKTQ